MLLKFNKHTFVSFSKLDFAPGHCLVNGILNYFLQSFYLILIVQYGLKFHYGLKALLYVCNINLCLISSYNQF